MEQRSSYSRTARQIGVASEQRVARVGNARIVYQVAGQGRAVVLLHGLSGSVRWWARNVPALARHFRVYLMDMIGFGSSRGQRFVLADTAGLIEAWMKELGEECFHMVGHSMGGLVAAELAAHGRSCVDRLVLVDAAALPMGNSMARSALNLGRAIRYLSLDFLPMLVSDALRAGPVTLLRAARQIHQADITEQIGQIAARTLIIWGEHDTLIPPERGEELHRALPGSELVIIHGAGHNPMWDRSDEFNRILIGFLMGEREGKQGNQDG